MAQPTGPYIGTLTFGDKVTLPDIWQGLHSDADSWQRAALAPDAVRQRVGIDDSSRALLRCLADCSMMRWLSLVESVGITQLGAIALSWCEGAQLEEVSATLRKIVKKPQGFDERTVRLLNPALQSPMRRVSHMIELSNRDAGQLALLILADPRPIDLDIAPTWMNEIPPGLVWAIEQRQF